MIKLAYVEVWNPKIHGFDQGFKPYGHFINTGSELSLDEFFELDTQSFIIKNNNTVSKLHLIKQYQIEDYTLANLFTYRLKLFQRIWRKKRYNISMIN